MPDFGAPVAQNVKGPSLDTLSDIMGLQQKQQGLQSGALTIQQQQQTLQKGAAATQMEQQSARQRQAIANVDWSKYDDGTGTVSTDKMLGDQGLQQAAGDQFLDVVKAGAAVRGQQMQNKQSLVQLNDGLRNQFGSMVGALRADPDVIADNPAGRQKVHAAITQFGQAGGPDAAKVAQIYTPMVDHAPQGQLLKGVNAIQLQAMDASRQAAAQAPSYVDTGAGLQQTNPQAAGGDLGGSGTLSKSVAPATHTFQSPDGNTWAYDAQHPGHAILVGQGGSTVPPPAQVPPGAPMHPDGSPGDPRGGSYQQMTPQMQAAISADMQRNGAQSATVNGAPVPPTTPPTMAVGQKGMIESGAQDIGQHYTQVQAEAQRAEQFTGIARNVQEFAHKAITGTPEERLNLMNGMLDFIGVGPSKDIKTASDMLQKNMSMLNLQGDASTNFKTMVTQMGQPHMTMNEEAIKEAAGQLIGQAQMKKALGTTMTPEFNHAQASGDQTLYRAKRDAITSIADPRVWEFNSLSPAEQQKFRARLTPDDDAALGKKYKGAKALGLLQ